jgi:predicted S18 family serine protease
MTKINVKHIANLNNESLRGLEFYQLEIDFLQKRLEEIAADNTAGEVQQQVEHFQNQLIIHTNVIDELKALIKQNTRNIELQLVQSAPFIDEKLAAEHEELNAKYLTEEEIIKMLRHEFNRFAANWM